jgi:hypothetical protein
MFDAGDWSAANASPWAVVTVGVNQKPDRLATEVPR